MVYRMTLQPTEPPGQGKSPSFIYSQNHCRSGEAKASQFPVKRMRQVDAGMNDSLRWHHDKLNETQHGAFLWTVWAGPSLVQPQPAQCPGSRSLVQGRSSAPPWGCHRLALVPGPAGCSQGQADQNSSGQGGCVAFGCLGATLTLQRRHNITPPSPTQLSKLAHPSNDKATLPLDAILVNFFNKSNMVLQ